MIQGYFHWWCFPRAAPTAFPFSTTMHSLPPVREGQRRTGNIKLVQNRDESCQKVTTNWWQRGQKGTGQRRVVWADRCWLDRCVSASNFLPPGVPGLPSRHAPHRHLAIAHNPLPSNNHLSQIHLRRPSLNYSRLHSLSSPTTDHLLIPGIIYEMTKCPHFPFSFPGTFPSPPHSVPCRPPI